MPNDDELDPKHGIDGRADDTPNPEQFSEFDEAADTTPSANRTPEGRPTGSVEPPSVAAGDQAPRMKASNPDRHQRTP
jgi:hypothetical protein